MAPPVARGPGAGPVEAVDENTEIIDFDGDDSPPANAGPSGDIGPMQPRRKDIPGFILPGTTGPRACEGQACSTIEDPFPDQMFPGGPQHSG